MGGGIQQARCGSARAAVPTLAAYDVTYPALRADRGRRKVPGGAAGLQNQSGGRQVLGGFDSLPSPPLSGGRAEVRELSQSPLPRCCHDRRDPWDSSSRIAPSMRCRTQVHVALRRREVGVPGQLLNRPRRRAPHRQMRTERVTQPMRTVARQACRVVPLDRHAPATMPCCKRLAIVAGRSPVGRAGVDAPQRRRQPSRHRHIPQSAAFRRVDLALPVRSAARRAAAWPDRRRSTRARPSRRTAAPPRRPAARSDTCRASIAFAASTSRSYSSKS